MATTFPQFEDLPPELRAMVWNQAIKNIGPRDVNIFFNVTNTTDETGGFIETDFFSTTPCPALLQVNRESRIMTQRSYRRLFKGRKETSDNREIMSRFPPESVAWETIEYLDPDDKSFCEEPLHEYGKIYMNLNIDTLCCHESDIANFDNDDYRAIRLLKMILENQQGILAPECPHLRELDVYARGSILNNAEENLLHRADRYVALRRPASSYQDDDDPVITLFDQESGKLCCRFEPTRGKDGYIFFE